MKSFLKKLVPVSIKHSLKEYFIKQFEKDILVPMNLIITDRMAYDDNRYPYVYKENEQNIYKFSVLSDYV